MGIGATIHEPLRFLIGISPPGIYYKALSINHFAMKKTLSTREHRILAEMLRELREEAGLKQVDLAKRLKVGQSLISKWEAGDRRIDLVQLRRWCTATDRPFLQFVRAYEKRLAGK